MPLNPFSKILVFLSLASSVIIGFFAGRSLVAKFTLSTQKGVSESLISNLSIPTPVIINTAPLEFSGWIAWWGGDKGYGIVQKYRSQFRSVSPVWFMVDSKMMLSEVGIANKSEETQQLKDMGVKILPSLGSEQDGEKLSQLFSDPGKEHFLVTDLVGRLILLGADGVDIDLEGIKKDDKDSFSDFLGQLSKALKANNMSLSVTVHAQTDKKLWNGVDGQDLGKIGQIADEVRIMAYDEYSPSTDSGPIASFNWIKDIANYNLELIPKEKIVFGIPSYGYIWTHDDSKGYQFDEMQDFLKDKKYTQERDKDSGELVVKGDGFVGWLSDSEAMKQKIQFLRDLGFSRFVIWHLGGLDEKLFDMFSQ